MGGKGQNYKLSLHQLAIKVPSKGVHLNLTGAAQDLIPLKLTQIPNFHLTLNTSLDNPVTRTHHRAAQLLPGLKTSGKASFQLALRRSNPNRIKINSRLKSKNFSLWHRGSTITKRKPSGFLRTLSLIQVKNLNADIPIQQEIILKIPSANLAPAGMLKPSFPKPKYSIFKRQAASTLYNALRLYKGGESRLSIR
ncbi:unnamed protein product, partial [marine sediment metagenome]